MLAGTSSKLRPRRSCRGARTPLRRNRRQMAAHTWDTVMTSCTRHGSAQGTDALFCRWMISACQLVSRPATPQTRERQAGRSVTGICSHPQGRRRRANGHASCRRSSASAAASSRSLWQQQLSQSFLNLRMVVSQSASGSATSCLMCFASACTMGTTGCSSGQPPRALGNTNGADG
jgi:hypothetical protein